MDGDQVVVGGLFPSQREWMHLPNKVCLFVGGYGCCRGDTILSDGVPIAERSNSSAVRTLLGGAVGSRGYLKGQAELYRVTTHLGKTVVVTLDHRFLTPTGWQALRELAVGAAIAGSADADDLLCSGIELDSLVRYYWDPRRYGVSPTQAAAVAHSNTWLPSWPSTFGFDTVSSPHARKGSSPLGSPQLHGACVAPRSEQALGGQFLPTLQEELRSLGIDVLLDTGGQPGPTQARASGDDSSWTVQPGHDPYTEVCSYPPTLDTWDPITSIEFDSFGDFYDISVPGPEHYEAQGLWHHNSGKSFALGKKTIGLALAHAGAPAAVVSPSYTMSNEIMVPTITDLLDGQCKLRKLIGESFSYTVKKSPPYKFYITHTRRDPATGRKTTRRGTIVLYSGENPTALKGPNLGSVGIDEPFMQHEDVFHQMSYRIRHKLSSRATRKINLTGTPESLNWGYELAEGDLADKFDVGVVQVSSLENKATGKDYTDDLVAGMDPALQKAMIEGNFVNFSKGQVFYAFDRGPGRNVQELNRPAYTQLGVGMDFNVNPMSACVFWVRTGPNPHIHFFHEIELPNSSTMQMCSYLIQKFGSQGLREVFPDASGRNRTTAGPVGMSDFNVISQCGFNINANAKGNPGRRDRFNAVNLMLSSVDGSPRMTVDPSCKKLIKYLTLYSHEDMNTKSQVAMSHLLDATTYPVAHLFPWHRSNFSHQTLLGV